MALTFLITIILGVVEGLTEFAPVSSTAHLLITGHLYTIPPSAFFNTFVVSIQSGAVLAAIIFFS
ncbi:MAG: undecaprenyl-diphosphate phosphatase, partial [Patescibacteria group bacterium]